MLGEFPRYTRHVLGGPREEKLEMPESAKPATESNFQAARDTKKIYFDESDKSKFVVVGANLDEK